MASRQPFFLCKQKTAYGVRISDWSPDMCSSDLMILESMPVLEHQHLRGVELVGADHRGQVVGLVAGKGDEERVVEQIFGLDVAARIGEREQDTVDGAVVERFACLRARLLAQEELERRAFLAQPRQEAGEQEGRDRGDDAHAKLSDKRRGGGGGHVDRKSTRLNSSH